MPMTSRLSLAFLAATALQAMVAGAHANELSVDTRLDPSSARLIESLVSGDDGPGRALDAVNEALMPDLGDASTANPSLDGDAGITVHSVAPGENPFRPLGDQPFADAPIQPGVTVPEPAAATGLAGKQDRMVEPVLASTASTADPAIGVRPSEGPASTAKVDDTALRYYAVNKDLKRLGAELRRLKALHPDWQPPQDLFTGKTDINEQPLWDIYKTGNFALVRSQIAQMQSNNPRWAPSNDLMTKLAAGEARALIKRALQMRRYTDVVDAAQANPSLLVCGEMQILWDVGESLVRLKRHAEAFDLYKYILSTCQNPAERLATVQKASQLMPAAGLSSLVALGKVMPDGTGEFESIGFDRIRAEIGAFNEHGDFTSEPPIEDLKRFVDFVQRTGSANDAALLGWYFYTQKEWKASSAWFLQAIRSERDPKSIEGLILTLRGMDRAPEALKLARRYMKASPEIRKQYVEIVSSALVAADAPLTLAAEELEAFEKIVEEDRSELGAQALGWSYLARKNTAAASDWFDKSVSYKPSEGGVIGLAVIAARAKNYRVLANLKTTYGETFEGLAEFKIYKRKTAKATRSVQKEARAQKPKTLMGLFSATQ